MKQKSGFHHFYRAFIEANKKKLKGKSNCELLKNCRKSFDEMFS